MPQPEVHLWRREYIYFKERGAAEMVRVIVTRTIQRAKELGKIDRIIGEPKFLTIPLENREGYFKVIVTFEFIMGPNFEMKKAKEVTVQ